MSFSCRPRGEPARLRAAVERLPFIMGRRTFWALRLSWTPPASFVHLGGMVGARQFAEAAGRGRRCERAGVDGQGLSLELPWLWAPVVVAATAGVGFRWLPWTPEGEARAMDGYDAGGEGGARARS